MSNVAYMAYKHSHILYSSELYRNVFENLPIVAYHHPNNLSDNLLEPNYQGVITVTMPGPFRVLFATAVNAPHAPILTTVYIETAVSEHFLSNSHSVSDMLLMTIETLRYERDCLRKAREAPLIHKAKTIESLRIKKRDEL